MRGVVPKDVQEQTQRMLAETGGAGFNFATAGQGMGIQAPQANLARSLGLTSLQLQQTGLGLSRDWQTMASAFIQSPLQVGQARLGFEQAAADIGMQKATAMYNARAGLAGEERQMAGRQYGRSVDTIESTLAARQAIASGISDIGQATSGALMGVGGAYGQLAMAQGGGVGGFGSVGQAQQAAPYASGYSKIQGMGYVPRAQAV